MLFGGWLDVASILALDITIGTIIATNWLLGCLRCWGWLLIASFLAFLVVWGTVIAANWKEVVSNKHHRCRSWQYLVLLGPLE